MGELKMTMIIGNKYNVAFAELMNGKFESEEMTLIEIHEYKDKEVYVYEDSTGYHMTSYNHDGENIDWDFMSEIAEKFQGA